MSTFNIFCFIFAETKYENISIQKKFQSQVTSWFLFDFRGHGTYMDEDKLHASVAGVVERVNKLVSVKPLKTR